MYRNINRIIQSLLVKMGPIQLRQPIPFNDLEQISPFLLLHHFDFMMKPGENMFNVPAHPHRGFMPITFMYHGSVSHEDSLGNKQVINDNEVQWINAGRGIIHSEIAGKEWVAKGGRFNGVQLWINLPKAEKMNTPSYQPLTTKDIVLVEKEGVKLRLVSGEHDGKKGPARSNVFTAMMQMKSGSDYSFNFPLSQNVLLYILEGDILINGTSKANQHDLIYFEHEDGSIVLEASTDALLLILSGEPINEPLVSHGPFVMTSQSEILEAMKDYSQGKMGYLY